MFQVSWNTRKWKLLTAFLQKSIRIITYLNSGIILHSNLRVSYKCHMQNNMALLVIVYTGSNTWVRFILFFSILYLSIVPGRLVLPHSHIFVLLLFVIFSYITANHKVYILFTNLVWFVIHFGMSNNHGYYMGNQKP